MDLSSLLYRIPFFRKRKNLPGHKKLVWLKYVILVLFVILLPSVIVDMVGQGSPWFCKYICPSGTLMAGIPLVASNEILRDAIGTLFAWKMGILTAIIILALWVYRPFCKYLCPLGAIYSLFNPAALYRYQIQQEKCTKCGRIRLCLQNGYQGLGTAKQQRMYPVRRLSESLPPRGDPPGGGRGKKKENKRYSRR